MHWGGRPLLCLVISQLKQQPSNIKTPISRLFSYQNAATALTFLGAPALHSALILHLSLPISTHLLPLFFAHSSGFSCNYSKMLVSRGLSQISRARFNRCRWGYSYSGASAEACQHLFNSNHHLPSQVNALSFVAFWFSVG